MSLPEASTAAPAADTVWHKLARYIVTGGLAAVVDAGGFALLAWAGVTLAVAAVASFLAAAVVNYLSSSAFVFRQPPSLRRFSLFLAGALVGMLFNVGVTLAAIHMLACPPLIAKVIGIGCAFLLNFALNLLLVFRPQR